MSMCYLEHKHREENSTEHGSSCGRAEDAGSCDVAADFDSELVCIFCIFCKNID